MVSIPDLLKLLPELENIIDESVKLDVEMAANVCEEKDKYVVESPCTGEFCEIRTRDLKQCIGNPIALFHTHPSMKRELEREGGDEDDIETFVNHYGKRRYSRRAARKNITPSAIDIVYPVLRDNITGEKIPHLLCIGNKEGIVCYPYRIAPEAKKWIKKFLKTTNKEGQYVGMAILKGMSLPYRDMYFGKEIWLRKRKRK